MEKFEQLQAHFESLNLVSKGKFDCWVEGMSTEPVKKNTVDGHHLCNVQYQANYSFEDCPQHPKAMIAILMTWLSDNDGGRRADIEGLPVIDGTPTGKGRYMMGMQLNFKEEIFIHKDENGLIDYKGEKWNGGESPATAATEIDLESVSDV